jgi:hypothetical protein
MEDTCVFLHKTELLIFNGLRRVLKMASAEDSIIANGASPPKMRCMIHSTACDLGQQSSARTAVSAAAASKLSADRQVEKIITMDTLNPNIKAMEYAVRGPIVARAAEIDKELKQVSCRRTCERHRLLQRLRAMQEQRMSSSHFTCVTRLWCSGYGARKTPSIGRQAGAFLAIDQATKERGRDFIQATLLVFVSRSTSLADQNCMTGKFGFRTRSSVPIADVFWQEIRVLPTKQCT